jgi:hypothetical protein
MCLNYFGEYTPDWAILANDGIMMTTSAPLETLSTKLFSIKKVPSQKPPLPDFSALNRFIRLKLPA